MVGLDAALVKRRSREGVLVPSDGTLHIGTRCEAASLTEGAGRLVLADDMTWWKWLLLIPLYAVGVYLAGKVLQFWIRALGGGRD